MNFRLTTLVLTYCERQQHEEVSKILHCSARKVSYSLPPARRYLPQVLDRMDIL